MLALKRRTRLSQNFLRYFSWSSTKSPYEILGVSKNASDRDIKKAYFEKAKKFHPDANKSPDASNKFKEISAAYDLLSDKTKRSNFDNFGTSGFGGNPGPGGSSHQRYQYSSNINPEEIFREFFRNTGFDSAFKDTFNQQSSQSFYSNSSRKTYEPPVYQCQMNVSFIDAALGTTREYHMNIEAQCIQCGGDGLESTGKFARCQTCNGTGYSTQRFGGSMIVQSLCHQCGGKGRTNYKNCTKCSGAGHYPKTVKAKVPIPPGVQDGQVLRIKVEGCEVLFQITVEKSANMWRESKNIHSYLDISYPQACFGGSFNVKGIHGDSYIDIPAGSTSGSKIVQSGMGIRTNQTFSRSGDHIFHVRIKTPNKMTERQRALIMALAEEEINNGNRTNQSSADKSNETATSKNQNLSFSNINGMVQNAIGAFFDSKPGDLLNRIREAMNLKRIEGKQSKKNKSEKANQC